MRQSISEEKERHTCIFIIALAFYWLSGTKTQRYTCQTIWWCRRIDEGMEGQWQTLISRGWEKCVSDAASAALVSACINDTLYIVWCKVVVSYRGEKKEQLATSQAWPVCCISGKKRRVYTYSLALGVSKSRTFRDRAAMSIILPLNQLNFSMDFRMWKYRVCLFLRSSVSRLQLYLVIDAMVIL